jgi:histidinol phosphatase-like enzyme (inositol monophosphatase family)
VSANLDLDAAHALAMRMARDAGHVILPHFRAAIVVDDKGGARGYDPVTVADRDAETVIRAAIGREHPTHGIRGEEHGWQKGTSAYTWVIDPIDGTRSFITGQLHWATLIALNEGGVPLVGVMHQPFVGESFSAIAGGEARWQRDGEARAMHTRPCATVGSAVLASTTPDMFKTEATLSAFNRVRERVRLTRFGGDCYAYCLLAMGLIDVVVELSLQAYDIQALIPIIEAAGGVVTDWSGARSDEGGDVVACGDRALHTEVLKLLAS